MSIDFYMFYMLLLRCFAGVVRRDATSGMAVWLPTVLQRHLAPGAVAEAPTQVRISNFLWFGEGSFCYIIRV